MTIIFAAPAANTLCGAFATVHMSFEELLVAYTRRST